jgi:anti-sigma regulatory factor (Ser/Thr protein kinase)
MEKNIPAEIELVIPIMPSMELAASKTAQAVASYLDLDEEKTAEVTMALIEACINAFEHGKSKDNNVYIRFILQEEALIIEIKDKGKGFDSTQVEKPDIEKKLHSKRKRGWGLQLMRELMDDVAIHSDANGTTITMTKKR